MDMDGALTQHTPAQAQERLAVLELGEQRVEVHCRRSTRARRMILRIDAARDRVELVLPPRVQQSTGLRFLEAKQDWLAERLARLPARIPFEDGAIIPFLGHAHRLRHRPDARRGVWVADAPLQRLPEIHVSGQADHFSRRLQDFLRAEARSDFSRRVNDKAAALEVARPRLTIRDTRSRWGSCSHRSGIALSWRLILMPENIRDYVVAHEVAHLVEMNHSPRFWSLVARLHPDFKTARQWLRHHGRETYRYG